MLPATHSGDRIIHIHGWTGCGNPVLLKEDASLREDTRTATPRRDSTPAGEKLKTKKPSFKCASEKWRTQQEPMCCGWKGIVSKVLRKKQASESVLERTWAMNSKKANELFSEVGMF